MFCEMLSSIILRNLFRKDVFVFLCTRAMTILIIGTKINQNFFLVSVGLIYGSFE